MKKKAWITVLILILGIEGIYCAAMGIRLITAGTSVGSVALSSQEAG